MKRLLAAALLLGAACGGRGSPDTTTPPATATAEPAASASPEAAAASSAGPATVRPAPTAGAAGTVLPTTKLKAGSKRITAEVADDRDEREVGLMNRQSMPADNGMLFVFPSSTRGGFWMKNTLIPLSIAFMESHADGWRVVDILEMVPCPPEEQNCPVYTPDETYVAALEMNKEWFPRNGVSEGAVIMAEGFRPSASS